MPTKPLDEEALFHAARRIAAPEARALFIEQACSENAGLAQRVRVLLQMYEQEGDSGPSPVHTADYPSIAERPGSRIGPYVLREQIGEGGFGLVFVAEQTEPVKRKVALKVIKPGMDSKQVIARFEAERQALALMDHPHIAKVLEAGATDSGRPYFVMELVRGIPITEYCDKNQLSPRNRLELFITVCQAIQHAHQKGVIHRDIKPSNVLVTSHDGKPVAKVIDFGVAKAIHQHLTDRTIYTNFAQMIGTPSYMSPEQAEMSGLDIDTRSDIYSLGVLLYELLTGTTPLEKKRLAQAAYDEVRRLIREEEPPKPSTRLSTSESIVSIAAQRQTEPAKLSKLVRGDLDWITMKALEKDRTRRYETANGLARDVQRYLSDEPVEASPPSATYRLRKFAKKNRAVLTTSAVILMLLTAGIAVSTWQAIRAARAERDALAAQREEAERAEGERQAKLDADARRVEAEQARTTEERERKYAEAIAAFVKDDFLALTSIEGQDRFGGDGLDRNATLLDILNRGAEKLKQRKDLDPRIEAELCWMVGVNYRGAGEAAKGIPFLERALELRRRVLGTDDPATLYAMNSLAVCYDSAGKLDRALPLSEETLRLMKAKLGADHPDTLQCMNNLAMGYRGAGKLDLAVPLLEETLKLRKAKLGADHPNTLKSMNNLAVGYWAAGKLDQALPLWEETLKLRKAKLGADHPDTLSSMNNLASGYRAAGKLDLALPLFEETLKLQKAKLGADHTDTLQSMNNLGLGYRAAGKLDLSVPLLEETLKLRKARLGADHPSTLNSMNNLAESYKDVAKLDQALSLYEETLKIRKARLGTDHPDTLVSMNNLAAFYRGTGKLDLALPLSQEAAAGIEKRRFRHEYAGGIVNNLIICHEELKQFDQAEAWRRKWMAVVKERAGADSTAYAGELAALGLNLLRQQKWSEAESFSKESLAIRQKKEPDAWTTFNTQSMLGGALLGQKKYADAEPLLLVGYEGMKAREKIIPPQGKERISEALDRLIEFYTATNKLDEAKKWQAERAKYPKAKSGAEKK